MFQADGRNRQSSNSCSISEENDEDLSKTCWVCLDDFTPGTDRDAWFRPCSCPRICHRACLARWCLQQAGKSEEKKCRFCHDELPDWQANLTPPGLQPADPVMSVHFDGKAYLVSVTPGEAGRKKFLADIRGMLKLRPEQEFDVTFECRLPSVVAGGGARVDLKGLSSYDAAVFCAALTAADRQRNKTSNAGKPNAPASGSGTYNAAAGSSAAGAMHATTSQSSKGADATNANNKACARTDSGAASSRSDGSAASSSSVREAANEGMSTSGSGSSLSALHGSPGSEERTSAGGSGLSQAQSSRLMLPHSTTTAAPRTATAAGLFYEQRLPVARRSSGGDARTSAPSVMAGAHARNATQTQLQAQLAADMVARRAVRRLSDHGHPSTSADSANGAPRSSASRRPPVRRTPASSHRASGAGNGAAAAQGSKDGSRMLRWLGGVFCVRAHLQH